MELTEHECCDDTDEVEGDDCCEHACHPMMGLGKSSSFLILHLLTLVEIPEGGHFVASFRPTVDSSGGLGDCTEVALVHEVEEVRVAHCSGVLHAWHPMGCFRKSNGS